MSNDKISKSNTDVVLSDADFTKEVFNRAERVKARRKKVKISILSLCSVFIVLSLVLIPNIISSSPSGDEMAKPPVNEEIMTGFADYVMLDGSYYTLTPQKSECLGSIIDSGIKEGEIKIFFDGKVSDYKFVAMVDGVRYLFFNDGVMFGNKIALFDGLGERALEVVKNNIL